MPEKFSHVRLYYRKDTKHYYAEIHASDGDFLLDLGEEEENMHKVIKLLKEEYGGIQIHRGEMN